MLVSTTFFWSTGREFDPRSRHFIFFSVVITFVHEAIDAFQLVTNIKKRQFAGVYFHLPRLICTLRSDLRVTLVYRIDVHARLLILRKHSPTLTPHNLILVCPFIDCEETFPPARSYFGVLIYWFWEKNSPLHVYWYWYVQKELRLRPGAVHTCMVL